MFVQRRLVSVSVLIGALAALSAACSNGVAPRPSGEATRSVAAALTCPSSGRSFYALDYSNDTASYDVIIPQHPAFVVLGDERGEASSADPAYFHSRDPAILVIAYIPMNYGNDGTPYDPSCGETDFGDGPCDNTPVSFDCTAVPITSRIANAMAAGYDGVFFDETPTTKPTYVESCAQTAKSYGSGKLVIMNPGTVPDASMFTGNVDIVSVESDYDATTLSSVNPSPWRWLSVEEGVDEPTAESHLSTFRGNGGYWYYATTSYTSLPSWFDTFASVVNATPPPACGGGAPDVEVHTYNQADGSEITGLWTVIDDASGAEHTGYSPLTVPVPAGATSVSVADYQQYHFSHWDDGTTARPETFQVTGPTIVKGWYDVE